MLFHLLLNQGLRQDPNPQENTQLPAHSHMPNSTTRLAARLLTPLLRPLDRKVARLVALLSEIGVRVDVVGDAGGPVNDVLGLLGMAPVEAAGVVLVHLALAAVVLHRGDELRRVGRDGALEVLGVAAADHVVAEAGDPGRGAHGAGRAAGCGTESALALSWTRRGAGHMYRFGIASAYLGRW